MIIPFLQKLQGKFASEDLFFVRNIFSDSIKNMNII